MNRDEKIDGMKQAVEDADVAVLYTATRDGESGVFEKRAFPVIEDADAVEDHDSELLAATLDFVYRDLGGMMADG